MLHDSITALLDNYERRFSSHTALAVTLLNTGLSLERRASQPLPSASLLKLFVLGLVLKLFTQHLLDPDAVLEVIDDDLVGGSGILKTQGLPLAISIQRLAELMIKYSDNTAANSLIRTLTTVEINSYIHSLGADSTQLRRRFMESSPLYNITSAGDVALFYTLLLKRSLPATSAHWCEWAQRLLSDVPSQRLREGTERSFASGGKPGTGTRLLHDSGFLNERTVAVLMICSDVSDIGMPLCPAYKGGMELFRDIGLLLRKENDR